MDRAERIGLLVEMPPSQLRGNDLPIWTHQMCSEREWMHYLREMVLSEPTLSVPLPANYLKTTDRIVIVAVDATLG